MQVAERSLESNDDFTRGHESGLRLRMFLEMKTDERRRRSRGGEAKALDGQADLQETVASNEYYRSRESKGDERERMRRRGDEEVTKK